jgi:hypothetical protein
VENIGGGTINPKTGLPEYFKLKNWLRKRVTPPKHTAGGKAMNWLIGEGSMISQVGGVKNTWKPSEGKWGIFGSTKASRDRDDAKASSAASHKMFEDFRRGYENENIAGIFTEDTEDNTDKLTDYSGTSGYETMIKTNSGLNPGANDIADYTDEYDASDEKDLTDKLDRDIKAINIHGDALNAKREGTGSALSSGLFGMLTQAQDTTATKGFAGSGDFAADFAKKTAIKAAEAEFGGVEREQESLGLETEQVMADAETGVKDLHEEYNQEFWNNMVSWDSAVNT